MCISMYVTMVYIGYMAACLLQRRWFFQYNKCLSPHITQLYIFFDINNQTTFRLLMLWRPSIPFVPQFLFYIFLFQIFQSYRLLLLCEHLTQSHRVCVRISLNSLDLFQCIATLLKYHQKLKGEHINIQCNDKS